MRLRVCLASLTLCLAACHSSKSRLTFRADGGPVAVGLDRLLDEREYVDLVRGRRIGVVTNHTATDRRGRPIVDLLRDSPLVELVAIFSPEHGFAGRLEGKVADGVHPSGLQIHSLYGETRKPTAAMLEGIDCLVFDIQDIGCRFYTYISTMGLAMQAAAASGIRFVVLDRPNPIGGVVVEGPVLDDGLETFVGWHPIAVRHGMTIGEIARLFVRERDEMKGLDLHVVPLRGWSRDELWDETGLVWQDPSPNMRNLNQAITYPGIGLLETTNLSVGRGTDSPFERFGAPWIDGRALAENLNSRVLPGVRFYPFAFTPDASKFKGERCEGVYVLVTDRHAFEPVRAGIHIACALRALFPDAWKRERYMRLLGHRATFDAIADGTPADEIVGSWREALARFRERRAAVLLYDLDSQKRGPAP